MEDILSEIEDNEILSEREVFSKIWLEPRKVFKFIIRRSYRKYFILLLGLAGIVRAFDRASMRDMGDKQSLLFIVSVSIVGGALLGWISYYIYAALIRWTGKWVGGHADFDSIIKVITYAMIPSIVGLLFLVPQLLTYGVEAYKADGDITSGSLLTNIVFYVSLLAELALGIWTIALLVVGISEVQNLSVGKAILNLLLPIIIIFVPILLLTLLFSSF